MTSVLWLSLTLGLSCISWLYCSSPHPLLGSSVGPFCLPPAPPLGSSVQPFCLPLLPLGSSVQPFCLPLLPLDSSVGPFCLPPAPPLGSSVQPFCLPLLPLDSSVRPFCLPLLPSGRRERHKRHCDLFSHKHPAWNQMTTVLWIKRTKATTTASSLAQPDLCTTVWRRRRWARLLCSGWFTASPKRLKSRRPSRCHDGCCCTSL